MRGHGAEHALHVLGLGVVAPAQQRRRARRGQHGETGPRREADADLGMPPRSREQGLDVIDERGAHVDGERALAERREPHGIEHRQELLEQIAPVRGGQHLALGRRIGITQANAQQESVELRVRQRKRAGEVDGILRGDHEERHGQRVRHAVHGHLLLGHRLEQRALRLRRGAIDLVGQQHLGEHRPRMEGEAGGVAVVDRHADDVGRQKIRGELDALQAEPEAGRERVRERRLAHAGQVLDQQVAAREQAREREPHRVGLAEQHAVDLALGRGGRAELGVTERSRGGGGVRHDWRFQGPIEPRANRVMFECSESAR